MGRKKNPTPEEREAQRAAQRRYQQSERGRAAASAAHRRYEQTPKGKAAKRRYQAKLPAPEAMGPVRRSMWAKLWPEVYGGYSLGEIIVGPKRYGRIKQEGKRRKRHSHARGAFVARRSTGRGRQRPYGRL